ncbi:MAG TPA: potassium channel family protein [Syntrophorhabdaceae bacterium]|nr:potassium channel family protein [Syntrophorhabdaceae bacterium]
MMNMVHFLVEDSPRRPYYAILLFIVVAVAFSFLYLAILPSVQGLPSLNHTGQGKSAAQAVDFLDCLYFSIGTQTTLGYGDLIPATVPAKITSMVQAAFGYVYLAFLVSVFTAQAVLRSRRFQAYLREMVRTLR